jgi:hypothetical protein
VGSVKEVCLEDVRIWKDNIKMNFDVIKQKCGSDSDQWWAFVNAVMKLPVP